MKLYNNNHQRRRAFTLFEGVIVVFVLALVAVVLLPALAAAKRKSSKINGCVNNLRVIGIALRIWEGDNGDKFPMDVPAALGGAQELIPTGNVAMCFQVMSNELGSPKFVNCPNDARHPMATNWDLRSTNISYFIGLNATDDGGPQTLLSGDANLALQGRAVGGGVVNLATNLVTWTKDRHGDWGYILNADGSVQAVLKMGTGRSTGFTPPYAATNRVVVP
jgi:type II secretory pathway pseudopilin PulG